MKKIGRSGQHHTSQRKTILFYLGLSFFVIMFVISRFVLINRVVEANLAAQAVLSDLAMAIFIALLARLLHRIHVAVSAVFLVFLSIFHIADMEMAAALNTIINLSDLKFAADTSFIKGSLSSLAFPLYTMFFLLSTALYIFVLAKVEKRKPFRNGYLFLCLFLSISSLYALSRDSEGWQSSNLLWLTFTRSIQNEIHSKEYHLSSEISSDLISRESSNGEKESNLYFRKLPASERNVLIVVLEGIPGAYLRQVQEWTGVKYPVEMPNLSRIAEKSLVVPNFLVHNRQTIRGLYSLLSGDYCKLTLITPKIYEYFHLPRETRYPLLPEILAKVGYATAYLQAADLAYMSKDKFMSEAGFEQVLGKEYFEYQHVPFGWGPDDRAFFEQAADFIGNLDKKTHPWFVTLLTVGTHHPYAIPEEFAAKFPSHKEAAVGYLDEAVGDFMERLQKSGILDDTLVLFTSDESHGVAGQPYGNCWGLAVAYAPESSGAVNPGVFGLIDIPYSVLDYLDLKELAHRFPERSIFREHGNERTILFGSFLSERKGVVNRRIDNSRVEVIQSKNGELFSQEYAKSIVASDEGRQLSEKLRNYQMAADSSLYDIARKDRVYVLLENDEFIIDRAESRVLSTGQYLYLPAGTTATVELEATATLDEEYKGQCDSNSEAVRLVLQMIQWYKKLPIPVSIPILKDYDSLELSFSFYTEDPYYRVWAYLAAESVHRSCPVKLKIRRFSVETKEDKLKEGFRINRLIIHNKKGNDHSSSPAYPSMSQGKNKALFQHPLYSKAVDTAETKRCIESYSVDGFDPDSAALSCNSNSYIITFSTPGLDERYEDYIILLCFKIIRYGDNGRQEVRFLLNGCRVPCIWLNHNQCDKEVVLYFPRTLLKEKGLSNTLSFDVHRPVAEKELPLLRGDVPPLGKPRDFKLISLALRPFLPPVAHAGGSYQGMTYTNSVEALKRNVGVFNFFEIDFEWSKDNHLICLHDWENTFTRLFGFAVEEPLDYNTFCKLKTVRDITPLTLFTINEFLSGNPEAKIVTDVKSSNIDALRKIAGFFPDFAERFIPQVYQPDEFAEAIAIGYKNIIWTLYRYQHIYDPARVLSHIRIWEDKYDVKPFAVTIPAAAAEKGVANVVAEAGIPVYAHTVNTCCDYVRLLQLGVSSIYTDCVDVTECYSRIHRLPTPEIDSYIKGVIHQGLKK